MTSLHAYIRGGRYFPFSACLCFAFTAFTAIVAVKNEYCPKF